MFTTSPRAFRAGGMEVVYRSLVASLRARGHEVDDAYLEALAYREGGPGGTAWGLPLCLPRTWRKIPTPWSLLQSVGSLASVARMLAAARPDVVYVHFIEAHATYFVLLQKVFGYRLVLSARGSDLLRTASVLDRIVLPRLLRRADAVVVASDAVSDKAASFGPDVAAKVVKIPNGVDVGFWGHPDREGPPTGTHTVVSVGRLEKVKGPDVLLRAFAEVARRIPDARLVVIGDGSMRPELERITEEQGIMEYVEFTGAMDRTAVRGRLHRADVFAMPSRSEGFGLAALEGMAAGLPVVGSAVGGLPELTGEGGVLVPPEQPAALAEALIAMMTDADLRQRTSAAAVQRAGVFSWEKAVDAYEAVLQAG